MIDTGKLIPDDLSFAANEEDEDQIIQLVLDQKWNELEYKVENSGSNKLKIERRGAFKLVDQIRDLFPRGDF
jgi:hypothetical protein